MFRKITHIITSILLVISTAGVSVSEHYCGYEKINISINTVEDPCCEMPSDCCHDEYKFLQIKADFTKPSKVVQLNISELHRTELPSLIIPLHEFVDNNSIITTDEFLIPGKHDVLVENQSFLL